MFSSDGLPAQVRLFVCFDLPDATPAPRNLTVYVPWRALSGRTAREMMYCNIDVRVGRTPQKKTAL
eukprot:200276-Pyramimonas_sp.AAC.1